MPVQRMLDEPLLQLDLRPARYGAQSGKVQNESAIANHADYADCRPCFLHQLQKAILTPNGCGAMMLCLERTLGSRASSFPGILHEMLSR